MAWHSNYGRYQQLDVSPSRVLKWMKCPKSFEYQYVRREKSNTGLAAMQGTALHDVFLEEMLRGGVQDVQPGGDVGAASRRLQPPQTHQKISGGEAGALPQRRRTPTYR